MTCSKVFDELQTYLRIPNEFTIEESNAHIKAYQIDSSILLGKHQIKVLQNHLHNQERAAANIQAKTDTQLSIFLWKSKIRQWSGEKRHHLTLFPYAEV
jgi:hypothetical protein